MAAAVRNMKALRLELEALQARPERGGEHAVPAAAEEGPGETEARSADAHRAAEEVPGGTEAKSAGDPETAGGAPEPAPPARPAVVATLGALALGAWVVVRHLLE
jgi:hypothetical protein